VAYLIQFIIFALLVLIGLFSGTAVEKKHYSSIARREKLSMRLPAVSARQLADTSRARKSKMVTGSVVVSIDHFKRLTASLRNLVGGRVASYESLVDRARREALLRMKEEARGASIILNVRIETSNIGSTQGDDGIGSVEALAYGTAVWLEPRA